MFYTVLVTSSINTLESSNDFMISMISPISSFEINQVNAFSALTAPFPLIFLSNLFIAFEVKLVINPVKSSLAKEITRFLSAFFPKSPNQEQKDAPDWIILDILALLSFKPVEILLAKAFLILVGFFIVRNISCGYSSSSIFFI